MPFDGPAGKRHATLMQRRHAIIAVNQKAMEEQTFRYVLKELFNDDEPVTIPRGVMAVFDMLIHSEAMDNEPPATEKLKTRVIRTMECSRPTAQKWIREAITRGIISREKKGAERKIYFSVAQADRARRILAYLEIIPDVVKIQIDNPHDKKAGIDYQHPVTKLQLPSEIYYNVIKSYK